MLQFEIFGKLLGLGNGTGSFPKVLRLIISSLFTSFYTVFKGTVSSL